MLIIGEEAFGPRAGYGRGRVVEREMRNGSEWCCVMIENHILDKSIPIPLYYQLKTIINSEIEQGNYKTHDAIPTEEELISQFNVSRTTVRQAITELVQEGRLYRIKSKGTFVAQNKIDQDFIIRLESFNDQMSRLGKAPSSEVLDFRLGVAPANVAAALQIAENSPIVFLQRRRYADSTPVVIQKVYLPSPGCDFVLGHDMSTESLYGILESGGTAYKVHHVRRVAEAIKAPQAIARQLGIKTGDPILFFDSVAYNAAGAPIEYTRAYYRGDSSKFEVTVIA